jgi:hypothetical protein
MSDDETQRNEKLQRVVQDMQEARASGDGAHEIMVDGAPMVLTNSPASGATFELTEPGQSAPFIHSFPPAATRPAGYPADAPFVANSPVNVTHGSADSLVLQWPAPDGEALLAQLCDECEKSGWAEHHDDDAELLAAQSAMAAMGMNQKIYRKAGRDRTIMLAGPMLMLIEGLIEER